MGPSLENNLNETINSGRPSQNRVIWLSSKEAALYLRISPNALRIMVHREQVKAYKLRNRLRFLLEDIIKLLGE